MGGSRLDFSDVKPDVKHDSAESVFSGKDPTVGVFDFDFDALEPYQGFQEKNYVSDDDEPGSRFRPDWDSESDDPVSDPESDSGRGPRPVMASTLPPRSRPPCDGCGAPPVIVAGDRGLCGRCASLMMDADAQDVSLRSLLAKR